GFLVAPTRTNEFDLVSLWSPYPEGVRGSIDFVDVVDEFRSYPTPHPELPILYVPYGPNTGRVLSQDHFAVTAPKDDAVCPCRVRMVATCFVSGDNLMQVDSPFPYPAQMLVDEDSPITTAPPAVPLKLPTKPAHD